MGLNDDGSFITKNIEDLRDGDTLLAKSDQDESDDVELKRVESAFGKTTYHLRYLTIRDAEGEEHAIQTTDEHPFWVEGMGWTNAGDLQVAFGLDLGGPRSWLRSSRSVIRRSRL